MKTSIVKKLLFVIAPAILLCAAAAGFIGAFCARRENYLLLVLACFVVTAVTIIIVRGLCKKVLTPLLELASKAEELCSGKTDLDFGTVADDEVGALAKALQDTRDNLQKYAEQEKSLAGVDKLTHVKNEKAYEEYTAKMDREIAENKIFRFAVVYCDYNNIRKINDSYGFPKGDLAIVNGARAICKAFGHSPVFRVGGDEFAIILRDSDLENREELLKKFKAFMANTEENENAYERISFACGMAEFVPGEDADVESVRKKAEELMRLDKADKMEK